MIWRVCFARQMFTVSIVFVVVDSPKGKLRVLYECMPMAYIMEQVSNHNLVLEPSVKICCHFLGRICFRDKNNFFSPETYKTSIYYQIVKKY